MSYIVVIPARYKSSRLKGKPLIDINGIPMIIRTYRQCLKAVPSKKIYIATDNNLIKKVCIKENAQFIMTSPNCLTGTDRIAEVSRKIHATTYINIQGDEPIVNVHDIESLLSYSRKYPDRVIFGKTKANAEEFNDYSKAKVVCDKEGRLMYSSRAGIPINNKGKFVNAERAIWLYSFYKKALDAYNQNQGKTYLDMLEDNEIIRFLEIGIPVYCIDMIGDSWAVDENKDLEIVEQKLKSQGLS